MMDRRIFEFELNKSLFRILCQMGEQWTEDETAWSSCDVPQVVRDAINERLGIKVEDEAQ